MSALQPTPSRLGSLAGVGLVAALVLGLALVSASGRSQTLAVSEDGLASAVFAGGCFWCMEPPYDALDGVVSTTSGFIGGHVSSPSYQQVVRGGTGHVEAVKVVYDPDVVAYSTLLEVFWRNIDPLDDGGQFCDRGEAYGSAIFVADEQERALAEASKQAIEDLFEQPVVTPVRQRMSFYAAEDYHQDYYLKNPVRYRFYRYNCGRDRRLEQLWGD
jgi:peptide-methionine (S)-S-oxide reductase